jgi:hypothetical protein
MRLALPAAAARLVGRLSLRAATRWLALAMRPRHAVMTATALFSPE